MNLLCIAEPYPSLQLPEERQTGPDRSSRDQPMLGICVNSLHFRHITLTLHD